MNENEKTEGAAAIPAVYANLYQVNIDRGVTKITFIERVSGKGDHERVAVVLTTDDAAALSETIRELLDRPASGAGAEPALAPAIQ